MKKSLIDLKSKNFLYVVFCVAIFNLGYFIMNKDSESLFLFICISCIVYMFQKNMIIILLYPILFVNGLILLRRLMNTNNEGFEYSIGTDTKEVINEKRYMIYWIQKNIPNLDNDEEKEVEENEYSKYSQFDVSIDEDNGLIPFKRIIDNIFLVDLGSKEIDMTPINNFINYIKYISQIKRYDDKSIYKEEIDFVNNLFEVMTNDYYGKSPTDNEEETMEDEAIEDEENEDEPIEDEPMEDEENEDELIEDEEKNDLDYVW